MRPVVVQSGLLPDENPHESDDPQNRSEDQPRENFFAHHVPPITQLQLAKRQRTNDQAGRLRARVPAARYDQWHEQCEHDGPRDLVVEIAHRRCRQHFAKKKNNEPAGAFAHHFGQRGPRIRKIQPLRTTELLEVLGTFLLGHIHHVVDGHDTQQGAVAADDGQCRAIVVLKGADGHFLIVFGAKRDKTVVGNLRHVTSRRRENDLLDPDVVDQLPMLVDNINHVERLGIATVTADMLQCLSDCEIRSDGHVFGGHQPTDAVFRIAEQPHGDLALFLRQHLHEPLAHFAGQLFEKRRAVVGIQVIEQVGHLIDVGGQSVDNLLALIVREMFEGLFRRLARKQPERNRPVGFGKFADRFGDLKRLKIAELAFKDFPVLVGNQLPEPVFDFIDHTVSPCEFTPQETRKASAVG